MKVSLASLLFAFLAPVATTAFPSGAGGCLGGVAAVGGQGHFREGYTEGTLAEGNITVSLDGTVLDPAQPFEGSPGVFSNLTVTADGEPFKGILVRIEPSGTGGLPIGQGLEPVLITDEPLLRDADDQCVLPVSGITHNSAVEKTEATVSLVTAASVYIDITVVIRNNAEGSEFYYSRFNYEIPTFPVCDICNGLVLGNPEGRIEIDAASNPLGTGDLSFSCAEVQAAGQAGSLDALNCAGIQFFASTICGCGADAGGPPGPEPTSSPTESPSATLPTFGVGAVAFSVATTFLMASFM